MAAAQVRMTQEQRSSATRSRLARAAYEQIKDLGYAQFRTAAVAKSAGVSQGGQLHHFPTKEDLALAAIEYAYALAEQKTARNLERFDAARGDEAEPIRAVIEDSVDFYFSSAFEVGVDVVKGAAANPDLRRHIADMSRHYRDVVERGWLGKLVERGWSVADAQDVLDLTTGLVRGFAIRKWIHRDQGQFKRLLERWVDMVYESFPANRPSPRGRSK